MLFTDFMRYNVLRVIYLSQLKPIIPEWIEKDFLTIKKRRNKPICIKYFFTFFSC